MIVNITDNLIDNSDAGHPFSCPVANAIRDATGLNVAVYRGSIKVYVDPLTAVYYTPPSRIDGWIHHYDEWDHTDEPFPPRPEPTSFELGSPA